MMIEKLAGAANRNGHLPVGVEQSASDWQVDEYWKTILQNRTHALNLPLDFVRPAVKGGQRDAVTYKTTLALQRELALAAENEAVSVEVVLLAALMLLLAKYTGQEYVVVGWTSNSVQHACGGSETACTTVVAGCVEQSRTWREFLAAIEQTCLQARAPKRFSYEQLVDTMDADQDASRNPLFDVRLKQRHTETARQKDDFALGFDVERDGISLRIEYDANLFFASTMERLLRHYCHLLEQLVQDTDQRLADLDMLAADGDEPLVYDRGHNLTTDSADPVRSAAHQPQRKQQAEHPEKSAAVPGERQASMVPLPALEAAEKRPDYPASSAQKRLFMLDKLLGRSTAYNVPVIRNINGRVDSKRLEKALQGLVERHESLRTAFQLEVESGALRQKVHSAVPFAFPVYALTEAEAAEMIRDFVRPFRLDKAPLFRAALIELTDKKESILILDMHHAITDGLSVGIMLKELAALYENRQLEPLSLQYKDYAVWESQLMHTQEWKKQEAYWLERFKEPVHPVRLRFSRPPALTAEATSRTLHFSLEENTATALQNLAHSTETTLFMVMLAAFTVLLSRLSGQDDIVVGTPISGRHREGLENIVGMFVNTLAIRNQPRSSQSFLTYLHQVKERLLDAYENQDYAFDQLVDKLNVPREINGNPLFNVMFQFAQHHEAETIDGLKLQAVEYDGAPGKFDLHFVVVQENQRALHLEMTYREAYLPDETAREFLAHFHGLVQQIVRDVQQDGKEEIATPHP